MNLISYLEMLLAEVSYVYSLNFDWDLIKTVNVKKKKKNS